jgi:hypothetical protein
MRDARWGGCEGNLLSSAPAAKQSRLLADFSHNIHFPNSGQPPARLDPGLVVGE